MSIGRHIAQDKLVELSFPQGSFVGAKMTTDRCGSLWELLQNQVHHRIGANCRALRGSRGGRERPCERSGSVTVVMGKCGP